MFGRRQSTHQEDVQPVVAALQSAEQELVRPKLNRDALPKEVNGETRTEAAQAPPPAPATASATNGSTEAAPQPVAKAPATNGHAADPAIESTVAAAPEPQPAPQAAPPPPPPAPAASSAPRAVPEPSDDPEFIAEETYSVEQDKPKYSDPAMKNKVHKLLLEQIDLMAASRMERDDLKRQIVALIGEIVIEQHIAMNQSELTMLANEIADDMLGYGPLEPLLADESITDIMVNGAGQVYVERKGKLAITDVTFRDDEHVMAIATRIVTRIGRRVDESSPICDARLEDGSRVNVIVPPLSIKGPSISIRKFSKKKITLDVMAEQDNISHDLKTLLEIAAECRLNIVISGGTGSGKTTLLNALSRLIDHGERIVTIEDAAELQLQQPHVVPLETRPPNLEGDGEVTIRGLVKNSLRMRPDRIIVGEVRSEEAVDMLQAMNTGHDGSMCTLHANSPREALTRLENMIGMAGINLPSKAVRTQIASAVHLIVQVNRMRDGKRRITHVTEIVGMEGDVVVTQDLFLYKYESEDSDGNLVGRFEGSGLRPHFLPTAEYYKLDQKLLEII